MSSFLGSFSSEFRTLQRKATTFGKDAIGQTGSTFGPEESFLGILFVKKNNLKQLFSTGSTGVAHTASEAILYIELDVSMETGDIVVDAGKQRKVDDIQPIHVFGGVLDHRQAYLSSYG